jgi:hypothetical protein
VHHRTIQINHQPDATIFPVYYPEKIVASPHHTTPLQKWLSERASMLRNTNTEPLPVLMS